ncbi:MAG: STAS domain-containing protein [Dermatophilaceae bacterium]
MDTEQRVVLEGRIDCRTAPAYRDALACAIAEGVGALSVDLSRAEIGDTAGLGVIIGAYDRARRHGRVLVVDAMSPRVARILHVSRLERVLLPRTQSRHQRTVSAVTA